MTVETHLVFIIGNPQEFTGGDDGAVGRENVPFGMLIMTTNTCQFRPGTGSQVASIHGSCQRCLGTGCLNCIRAVPAVRCLHFDDAVSGMVIKWIGSVFKSNRFASGTRVAGPMTGEARVVVAGAAKSEVRRVACSARITCRRIKMGCINGTGIKRQDKKVER